MSKYIPFVKASEGRVPVYTPPGHDDTFNRRLIGPTDGAQHVELIVGEMGRSGHAVPHAHAGFEQSMYMLEGKLEVTDSAGKQVFLEPGDSVFFPIGCEHKVVCVTEKSKFLVIYTPPRQSSNEKV
jgi:quercetin dioxygenase-like cupin family protein